MRSTRHSRCSSMWMPHHHLHHYHSTSMRQSQPDRYVPMQHSSNPRRHLSSRPCTCDSANWTRCAPHIDQVPNPRNGSRASKRRWGQYDGGHAEDWMHEQVGLQSWKETSDHPRWWVQQLPRHFWIGGTPTASHERVGHRMRRKEGHWRDR